MDKFIALRRFLRGWFMGLAPWLALSGSRLVTGIYEGKFFTSPAQQVAVEGLFCFGAGVVAIAGAGGWEAFCYCRRDGRTGPIGFWTALILAFAAPLVAFGVIYSLIILALLLEVSAGRLVSALILMSVLGLFGAGMQTLAWSWLKSERN